MLVALPLRTWALLMQPREPETRKSSEMVRSYEYEVHTCIRTYYVRDCATTKHRLQI